MLTLTTAQLQRLTAITPEETLLNLKIQIASDSTSLRDDEIDLFACFLRNAENFSLEETVLLQLCEPPTFVYSFEPYIDVLVERNIFIRDETQLVLNPCFIYEMTERLEDLETRLQTIKTCQDALVTQLAGTTKATEISERFNHLHNILSHYAPKEAKGFADELKGLSKLPKKRLPTDLELRESRRKNALFLKKRKQLIETMQQRSFLFIREEQIKVNSEIKKIKQRFHPTLFAQPSSTPIETKLDINPVQNAP